MVMSVAIVKNANVFVGIGKAQSCRNKRKEMLLSSWTQ